MANWVKNIVKFNGTKRDIDALEALISPDKTVFFGNILPTPEQLNIDAGANAFVPKNGVRLFLGDADCQIENVKARYGNAQINIDEVENFVASIRNYLITGYSTWYDWRCANWGTKWEPAELDLERESENELQMVFNTAWSNAKPIFLKLLERFPKINMGAVYADEFIGSNVGFLMIKDGMFVERRIDDETDEAIAIANNIWDNDWSENDEAVELEEKLKTELSTSYPQAE